MNYIEMLESQHKEIERLKNDNKRIIEITNQKIKIINDVREYIKKTSLQKGTEYYRIQLLEILDKENK